MTEFFAFDFDGVICDSSNETGLTAWRAAQRLWPDEFEGPPDTAFRASFARCRPVIEKGLHNLPLVAMLRRGISESEILADFDARFDDFVVREGLSEDQLRHAFGAARDDWLSQDRQGWLAAQGFFPGVVEAVNALHVPKCIITTKERRFTLPLLADAGLVIDEDEVFTLESMEGGSKRTILQAKLDANPRWLVHFFEDRLPTQLKLTDMDRVRLYIVDWGYNTEAERQQARSHDAIELLDADGFARVLAGGGMRTR